MAKYNAHPGAAEHNVIEAIDGKAQLERSATPDENLAVLVTTGTIPPDDAVMPMDKARKMSAAVFRELAALNMTVQIYMESLKAHSIPQIVAAYPYILKKVTEENVVENERSTPAQRAHTSLSGLSDEC
ncbi:MAG TPA: hypothetical protein HPP81_02500 [Deltaproteobacteria bacterium]|jgi:hypothetical protein|nr:hypothetical protein [Deltaproteobacteria bacterium]